MRDKSEVLSKEICLWEGKWKLLSKTELDVDGTNEDETVVEFKFDGLGLKS